MRYNVEEIAKVSTPAIADAIYAFREKKVIIHPGGGGQYGIIELPSDEVITTMKLEPKDTQMSLSDY